MSEIMLVYFLGNNQTRHDRRGRVEIEEKKVEEEDAERRAHKGRKAPRMAFERTREGL